MNSVARVFAVKLAYKIENYTSRWAARLVVSRIAGASRTPEWWSHHRRVWLAVGPSVGVRGKRQKEGDNDGDHHEDDCGNRGREKEDIGSNDTEDAGRRSGAASIGGRQACAG
jgi:hypothetical protein